MIFGVSLWFMLLFLLTCGLWFRCRSPSGAPQENLKEIAESELRKEQKRSSSLSEGTKFMELSSNTSSSIPLQVWSDNKKSSTLCEDCLKVPKEGYTTVLSLQQYDTSDLRTITTVDDTQPDDSFVEEHSSGSAVSYMDHIRAPTNVFNFYANLENKQEEEIEKSFSCEEYAIRGARKTVHVESGSILGGDVRLSKGGDSAENSDYLSTSNPQILDNDFIVEISYSPPPSSSVISVNVSESNSRTLLHLEEYDSQDEDLLSLETYIEPYNGKQNHTSCQRPKEEKPDSNSSRCPSETRGATKSSVSPANALLADFLETPSHLHDQQLYKKFKESTDTQVESKSALVIKHFIEPSYGPIKIRHRGRNLDSFLDPSSTVEAARSACNICPHFPSNNGSSRASMELENQKRVVYDDKLLE